jgi:cbb3-type cytochrome oxidase subunit 3
MSGDAMSMFWLTILFFIVVPGILYWACCELAPESKNGADHPNHR